jgi:hypothetical protein
MTEVYASIQEKRQREASRRRDLAAAAFHATQEMAQRHGLDLVRKSSTHYQLFPQDRAWLQNVYPGNCRLHWDRNKAQPPFLRLDSPWTLRDVVLATIAAMNEGREG